MFTEIDDIQLKSELNTTISLVNLYQKQLTLLEYFDDSVEISENDVFTEATEAAIQKNDTAIQKQDGQWSKTKTGDNNDTAVDDNAGKSTGGFLSNLGNKIWTAIKKFFNMIRGFFRRLFKKDNAQRVGEAALTVGNFFENASDEEIQEVIDTMEKGKEGEVGVSEGTDSEGTDNEAPVTEMFVYEASNEVTKMPKNTPADDLAYLKKALYAMKTQKGFFVSRIHKRDYPRYAKQMIALLEDYAKRINDSQGNELVDMEHLINMSRTTKAKMKFCAANLAAATTWHSNIGGSLVSYKGYEAFYKSIMEINAALSKSIGDLEKAMANAEKNIKAWEKKINSSNNSQYGRGFTRNKYPRMAKNLHALYTDLSDIMKYLATTVSNTVAKTMTAEVNFILTLRGVVVKVNKTSSGSRKKKNDGQQQQQQQQQQTQNPPPKGKSKSNKYVMATDNVGLNSDGEISDKFMGPEISKQLETVCGGKVKFADMDKYYVELFTKAKGYPAELTSLSGFNSNKAYTIAVTANKCGKFLVVQSGKVNNDSMIKKAYNKKLNNFEFNMNTGATNPKLD